MTAYKKRPNFFETQEGMEVEAMLKKMVKDATYKTEPSYTANTALYPNNVMPFVDKHMNYLRNHPATEPRHYLANLRLMTRIKSSAR